ncbi:CTD nuclear envelope phosphatase 1 [Exaiptasia diaphana]|uniref:protein-serine/threonine phosphatase n=1 Tax=Exaiptasia diaphana TaxID=2652724 RepID=A0A913Y2K6_EXADI|nr:CTD nuclear envelope phosphatase 1 [Exaiptasia diaphana]KXJ19809.1 CTD nuclear envelope phosphatase 1 [Exaiptasia diaphana]
MSIYMRMDSVKSVCNVAGFRFVVVALSKLWTLVLYLLRRNLKMIIQHKTIKYDPYPLSPLSIERLKLVKKKTLVLDLDETLVHAHHDGVARQTVRPGSHPDFTMKLSINRRPVMFSVYKRPHVDYFLDCVSQWYNLVVFTASTEQYGSAVTDHLDNNRGILNRRYFRQHCSLQPFQQGYSMYVCYVKELSKVCDDLSSVFILDNSPEAYSYNLDNAIAIKSWFADPSDTALLNLLPMLDALRFTSDVRSILGRRLHTYVNR